MEPIRLHLTSSMEMILHDLFLDIIIILNKCNALGLKGPVGKGGTAKNAVLAVFIFSVPLWP